MTRASKAWMRGAGPLAVLKLLQEREMYGYELAEALDRRSDGVLALGHTSLYPLLYNLEAKGLIRHRATRVATSPTSDASRKPSRRAISTEAGSGFASRSS